MLAAREEEQMQYSTPEHPSGPGPGPATSRLAPA